MHPTNYTLSFVIANQQASELSDHLVVLALMHQYKAASSLIIVKSDSSLVALRQTAI